MTEPFTPTQGDARLTRVPIPHAGLKPAWLEKDELIFVHDDLPPIYPAGECGWLPSDVAELLIEGFRYALPADHWAAPVIRAGLCPWNAKLQGDGPPSNYVAGGKVMFRNGSINSGGMSWEWTASEAVPAGDIIGYEPATRPEPDYKALAEEARAAADRLVRSFNFGDDSGTVQTLRSCAEALSPTRKD
jgi:hypothetical protein